MKRSFAFLLSIAMLFSFAAFTSQASTSKLQSSTINKLKQSPSSKSKDADAAPADAVKTTEDQHTEDTPADDTSEFTFSINVDDFSTFDELEDHVEEDVENAVSALSEEWEALADEIDSYEAYRDNTERISEFYAKIISETEQTCVSLKEYAAIYARMILDSDMSSEKMYKAIDGIHDAIYDDACDEIHDEIYDGLIDEMHDHLYSGVLDKQPDGVDYKEWSSLSSNEYAQWSKASSKVYKLYSRTSSNIYSFYSGLGSVLYRGDLTRAEKKYDKFLLRIAKDKGMETDIPAENAIFDTALRNADSIDELESVVDAHVAECVQALTNEWTALTSEVNSFEGFSDNIDTIEDFHSYIVDSTEQLLAMICDYGVLYTELIMNDDTSAKEKYTDFEDFYTCIYDEACQVVYDDIYEDLLESVYDYYYEGIIRDAKENVPYSDWADARSDTYGWWVDARSDVYGDWVDTRSDLYSFYVDIRGELFGSDIDGANKVLEKFKRKVDKMK